MATRSLLPEDDNFDPLSAPTLVMHHTVPSELPPLESILIPPENEPARGVPKRLLGLGLVAVLIGGGVWLMLRPAGETGAPAAAPAASAASAAPAPAAAVAPPPPAPAASEAVMSAPAAEPAVAPASSPTPAASAPERRKRIPEPVARPQALEAAPAPAASQPEAVVAAPPPPAPASEPVIVPPKSVTELCGAGNLLTRGFCEHRECAKAEHIADAVCLRLKEAEEARRFRQ